MLDGMSMDQLRTFIAAADEGSFSAAGRKLRRAQSVVSQTLANLELQVGFALFDRSGRYPQLTEQGRALLENARAAASSMDDFKARARTLAEGLEPELSVTVDVMFPIARLTEAVRSFHREFPATPLRLGVEVLGAALQPMLDGRTRIAVVSSILDVPEDCSGEHLVALEAALVVAPGHPLAALPPPVPRSEAAKHVQLILTDRSQLTSGRDYGVLNAQGWRLADLGAKHAFLKAGLGWGSMPLHIVGDDLEQGALVRLELEGGTVPAASTSMFAVYRREAPPGPAGRRFIDLLKQG
jgi:DNA-binding transcriptional LysR family regulator